MACVHRVHSTWRVTGRSGVHWDLVSACRCGCRCVSAQALWQRCGLRWRQSQWQRQCAACRESGGRKRRQRRRSVCACAALRCTASELVGRHHSLALSCPPSERHTGVAERTATSRERGRRRLSGGRCARWTGGGVRSAWLTYQPQSTPAAATRAPSSWIRYVHSSSFMRSHLLCS